MAVETAKEVANDKTLRNKAEKERRLREKNQNNTKKFIDERKIMAMKQGKEKEKLDLAHKKQQEDLIRDIQLVRLHSFNYFIFYIQTIVITEYRNVSKCWDRVQAGQPLRVFRLGYSSTAMYSSITT